MAGNKQLAANRQNALKSTGPKTPAGKAKAAHNATRHGLLARLEVLPRLERAEDWEEHLDLTLADLNPEGYLEQSLAERIALVLWRLGRVARYEREIAAIAIENAERDAVQDMSPLGICETRMGLPLGEAEGKAREARKVDQYRRRRIIPKQHDLVMVGRYEAHLERSLYRALHELQRLQAARQNRPVAAPVVVDVDVTGVDAIAPG